MPLHHQGSLGHLPKECSLERPAARLCDYIGNNASTRIFDRGPSCAFPSHPLGDRVQSSRHFRGGYPLFWHEREPRCATAHPTTTTQIEKRYMKGAAHP